MNSPAVFKNLSETQGLAARLLSQIQKWREDAPDDEVLRINLVEWCDQKMPVLSVSINERTFLRPS